VWRATRLPRVPKFCRHGTLTERCPICQPAAEADARSAAAAAVRRPPRRAGDSRPRSNLSSRSRLVVRHERRAEDDGYRSSLAPGLRSSEDARRLAEEIGFAAARLETLSADPPGLYAEVATAADPEEAAWLAFLIVYLGPLEEADAFAGIAAVRTPWGTLPDLTDARVGPRGAHVPGRGAATIEAYVRFAQRAGGEASAIGGDPAWTAEQRFERAHERLALPGMRGRARYDLLVTLGALGRHALVAPSLLIVDDSPVSLAAKRVFGIGDRMTLESRSTRLAKASGAPVAALDLALENWARAERITQGVPEVDGDAAGERALAALGL
jgi:hypothetical protein